jgi:hypothetical protein
MSSSEEYSFQGDNTDNTQRSNCTQISVVAKRTRVRKLDNSKVTTECGEKKCGHIPDIKKEKKKKVATMERCTEYAKLATTSSRGLSTAPNDQPKMSNKRAAHTKITFEQAMQKKKADSKSILKLSPTNGGNIVLNAAEGQKPLGALHLLRRLGFQRINVRESR